MTSPLAATDRPRYTGAHHVPATLSSFVGRAREVASVHAALDRTRLLTLTGPGGAGKTRLAREIAATLGGTPDDAPYADGVWWVELAPVVDDDGVASALASALGVRLDSTDAPALVLASAVGQRRLLLVLDNCEHVIGTVAVLAETLLRACPQLRVLATSREALAVEGEAAWVVPPLAHPPRTSGHGGRALADATPSVDEIASYDAVQLFVERARALQPTFALTDRNAAAVATVCARLDGIPLALELAAPHVGALGIDALATRLDDAFALLTRGRRTAPARHQTLRALLDWSYARLAPEEQTLLCQLAVFRDAATFDAVVQVCGDGTPIAAGRVLSALSRLVDQSLVTARDVDGAVRYSVLETVRQFGAAQLAGTPEETALRDRHLAWAADLMTQAEPRLWSARWFDEAARLTPVMDDLRAALLWAGLAAADDTPASAARATDALRIVGPLMWGWVAIGGWDEATHLTELALQAAASAGLAAATDGGGWTTAPDASPVARRAFAIALSCWLVLLSLRDRYTDAMPAAASLLALWDAECASGDPLAHRWRSYARVVVAEVQLALGDAAAALAWGDGIMADAVVSGDARAIAFGLSRRGFMLAAVGEGEAATQLLRDAAARWAAQGDPFFLALAQQTLADLALATGDIVRAAEQARASLATRRDAFAPFLLARSLEIAARTALATSDSVDAAGAVARLLGAADGVRTRSGIDLPYYDRPAHDQAVATATTTLGSDAFHAAWSEGQRFDTHAAIDHALSLPRLAPAALAPAVAAPTAPAPVAAPSVDATTTFTLSVRVLGPLRVTRDDAPNAEPLPLGKVAELLLWLVLHPQGTKEKIGLDLWPDASPVKLRNTFHFTLHHLRRALGDHRWIAHEHGHYRLDRVITADGNEPAARLDGDADALFATSSMLVRAARTRATLDESTLAEAHRVLGPLTGTLADGLTAGDWVVVHQDRARAAWDDGMTVIAQGLAAADRCAEAATVYGTILARDPLRESAHRALMTCYARAGEPSRALAHYDSLVALLAREVGARPARETQLLADQIRRG